jgi:drug/metabolite transporter (DMT)-like permease
VVARAGRVVPDAVSIKSKKARGWAALLVVWVVWGSTYLGIRVAVESMPPLLMAGARFVIAGLILFPLAVRSGRPTRTQWLSCALTGTLLLAGGNGALCYAERTVPTGLASLLIATVPLWLLGIDGVLTRTRLGWMPMAGLAVGLAGVGLLSGTMRGSVPISGVVVCLCAAASWAFGTVYSRRLPMPGNPALGSAMQMLTAGVVLLCAGGIGGESVHFGAVTGRSWLAFGYLILVGSLIGFSSYIVAVRLLPTSTVATYAYVNPVTAVLLGTTLLGERLSPMMVLGGLLIVGAVVLVVGRRKQGGHL